MRSAASARNLLIALNTGRHLARESICKLALSPGSWPSSEEPLRRLAARLEVPPADLRTARRLARSRQSLAQRELRQAERLDASILTITDPEYPGSLRQLDLPPPVLPYYRQPITFTLSGVCKIYHLSYVARYATPSGFIDGSDWPDRRYTDIPSTRI